MSDIIKRIDEFAAAHNQFTKDSKLYVEVQKALNCSIDDAKSAAAKLCNVISLYAILYGADLIKMDVSEWIKYLIKNDDMDASRIGWIKSMKKDIFKRLNLNIQIVEFKSTDNLPEGIFQIKIENSHGTHFIAGYTIDTVLYIADTSYRGVHVKATEALKNDNLISINQYIIGA